MCLLRETGEEDGLLGQGVLKMCIETADAELDLYLPFFMYVIYGWIIPPASCCWIHITA